MIFIINLFIAGLVSFLSLCIFPILPIYLNHLSANKDNNPKVSIPKRLFFAAGLSFSFVTLGFSVGFLGTIIHTPYFFIITGGLVIILAIYQLSLLRIPKLNKEKEFDIKINTNSTNCFSVLLLGFFLAFRYTPFVGLLLLSVLAFTANGNNNAITGGLYLLIYSAGLSLPFILLALFYNNSTTKIKLTYKCCKTTKILRGVVITTCGLIICSQVFILNKDRIENIFHTNKISQKNNENIKPLTIFNKRFMTLSGDSVTLNSLKGKKVFIKFWATWCPICLEGLPDLIELSNEYEDSLEIDIYSVVSPGINHEIDQKDFIDWAKSQNFHVKTLIDPSGELLKFFKIRGYPTGVYLDKQNNTYKIKIGHNTNEEIINSLK